MRDFCSHVFANPVRSVQSVKDSGNSTFFTKRSTVLVQNGRKTKFLHSFSVEQTAKLFPFFLWLSFRLKDKKRYFFMKKKSGIFSFRVNDILTLILFAFHPFLTLPKDDLKRESGTFFS